MSENQQPQSESKGYWWCPYCKEECNSHHVTYAGLHENCGHPVEWIEPQNEELLLTGNERIDIAQKYKSQHPNPEVIADSDAGYINRLLKAQLAKCHKHEQEAVEQARYDAFMEVGKYIRGRCSMLTDANDCFHAYIHREDIETFESGKLPDKE
jgi:hypothetical protein